MGTACYVKGAMQILDAIKEKLNLSVGEVTEDKLFSLEVCRCFGACGLAPAVLINDDVHGNLKPSSIEKVLNQYK